MTNPAIITNRTLDTFYRNTLEVTGLGNLYAEYMDEQVINELSKDTIHVGIYYTGDLTPISDDQTMYSQQLVFIYQNEQPVDFDDTMYKLIKRYNRLRKEGYPISISAVSKDIATLKDTERHIYVATFNMTIGVRIGCG